MKKVLLGLSALLSFPAAALDDEITILGVALPGASTAVAQSRLALAAIGLYGVMAFWVTQRTREIGLRMAVGGGRGTIVGFVVRRGMTPILAGLALGVLAALPVAWTLQGALLEVAPFDPLVFGAVLGVLLCAGGLGCLGPALRATRIDPQAALGSE